MTEIIEIKATARPRAGKGAARQARREGNVPAVIYGDNQPAEIIAITLGVLFAGVYSAALTAMIERLSSILNIRQFFGL